MKELDELWESYTIHKCMKETLRIERVVNLGDHWGPTSGVEEGLFFNIYS